MKNFSDTSQAIESACRAWAYRTPIIKSRRRLAAALDDVERFEVGSEEWKEAVRRNAETLSE